MRQSARLNFAGTHACHDAIARNYNRAAHAAVRFYGIGDGFFESYGSDVQFVVW